MQKEQTKMCPSCEGNIAMDATFCQYCGSNVFERNENLANQQQTKDDVKSLSYEETLSSLYPPPYKPKAIQTASTKYYDENNVELDQEEESLNEDSENSSSKIEKEKSALIPTISFWLGINILVFSVFLLFFSQNGVLYLKWNAKFWFIYSMISMPLLYFGFKGLKNLE